jgi:hypothetical protein
MNYSNFWNFLKITEISAFFTSMGLVSIHILLLSMTDIFEISPKFPWNYQNFHFLSPQGLVSISITIIIYYWNFRNFLEITEISEISLKLPNFPLSFTPRPSIYIYHYYYLFLKFPWNYQIFHFLSPQGLVSISITILIYYWNFRNFLEITKISAFFHP